MTATETDRNDARRQLQALLNRLERAPIDSVAAHQAADLAIDHGFEAMAWQAVSRTSERIANEPRLWQMLALLHRGLDRQEQAIEAYRKAERLAPGDARIAHGLALTSLEAGLPASELFEKALRLEREDSDIRLGYVAALKAEGRVQDALAQLEKMLAASPLWIQGHQSFARIHATLRTGQELASIDAAIASHPRAIELQALRIELLSRLVSPAERLSSAARARARFPDALPLIVQEAVAASEDGQLDRAEALFLAIGKHDNASLALAILRHLVRAGRFVDADRLAARLAATPEWVSAWAYRHTAWRALNDPRLGWLDRGGDLVRSYAITAALPPLDQLADVLRALHADVAQPLDQSVRGGTQTDGSLFLRIDPVIRRLRDAVADAVQAYVGSLPPIDAVHPLLSAGRDEPARFAGSWSVRLTGAAGGHHTNHVHGMGWVSSALHIILPGSVAGGDGSLTFGAPPAALGLDMAPSSSKMPVAGRLVLFPSYLWHGVTPFGAGERLTAAFDVARPRG